jgi:outer membrane protein assembly factor BamB
MKHILITQFILFLVSVTVLSQEVKSALTEFPHIGDENSKLFPAEMLEQKDKNQFITGEVLDSSQISESSDSVKIIKTIHLKKTTFSPVVTTSTKYYISTSDGSVICLDTQGTIIWEYNTDGLIHSSLLKEKDLIVTMTNEGDLFTINANNGDLVQVIGIGESIDSDIQLIDLEYNRMNTKGIVFGTVYGNIYCYELYSLEMVWENYLSDSSIVSKPLVVKNKIIFESIESYYCVNARNGTLIWKWKKERKGETTSFYSDLISNGKSVFYVDEIGELFSIDLLLGTAQWKKGKKLKASGKLFTITNSNEMIVHTKKNQLLVVNQSNGKVKKEIELPEDLENVLPVYLIENGTEILVGFLNGSICKLDIEDKSLKPLILGKARVISIVTLGDKEFLTNNLNGKLTHFVIQ